MDFIYFMVTGSKSWEPHFHQNFFITQSGFLWGVIGAAIIGAVCALAFYFGFCNNKNSGKYAKMSIWWIALAISGLVAYGFSDLILIGSSGVSDNGSIFRAYSFYKANDDYYTAEGAKPNSSDAYLQQLNATKNEISSDLDRGGDVRFEFDLTTALFAVLVYFLVSMFVKRYTYTGKSIPMLKP